MRIDMHHLRFRWQAWYWVGLHSFLFILHIISDWHWILNRLANLTGKAIESAEPWISLHNRIKPTSKLTKVKHLSPPSKKCKKSLEDENIKELLPSDYSAKISVGIDKNSILSEYQESCTKRGIHSIVTTIIKGENSSAKHLYPLHHRLISECRMKPSRNLQYRVKDLHLDNIVVFLIKNQDAYLTNKDINNLSNVNGMYQEMVNNVLQLRSIDFSKLKLPRLDYAEQTRISQERVDLEPPALFTTVSTQGWSCGTWKTNTLVNPGTQMQS